MNALFDALRDLNLPRGDYAIFGSGPLIIRNIIPASNDLDVICRGKAWEQIRATGKIEYLEKYDLHIVTMLDGRLTFGNQWGIGQFVTNDLIDTAEHIKGIPFVRLEHVMSYKEISRRPKDLQHLEALQVFLTKTGSRRPPSI